MGTNDFHVIKKYYIVKLSGWIEFEFTNFEELSSTFLLIVGTNRTGYTQLTMVHQTVTEIDQLLE